MNEEVHISSYIVYCQPSAFQNLRDYLLLQKHIDIYGEDQNGKFVIVSEGQDRGDLLRIIDEINAQPGIINISMVYHQVANEHELNQISGVTL